MFKDIMDLRNGDRDEIINCNRNDNNLGVVRQSDFSIDHILNRAGNKNNKCDNSLAVVNNTNLFDNYNNDCSNISGESNNFSNCAPMFSWLQYTRYRPPKLPRSMKIGPVKRTPGRLPRVPFTATQLNSLENAYQKSTYLSSEDANKLAASLELTSTRVKIWFQNRRARERREIRGSESETLDLSLVTKRETTEFNRVDN